MDGRYETKRLRTIEFLFHKIIMLHIEGVKVTFIDMNPCMKLSCFARDGDYFNFEGNKVIGYIVISVINRHPRVNRGEV